MPIVNIIKSIGIYALTLVLVRIFLMWWLDKYDDWPNLAPFIEGIFAFTSTAGYLEDNGGSSAEKRMTVLIAGLIIIGYWIWDIYDTIVDLKASGLEIIFLLFTYLRGNIINILAVLGLMKFDSSE